MHVSMPMHGRIGGAHETDRTAALLPCCLKPLLLTSRPRLLDMSAARRVQDHRVTFICPESSFTVIIPGSKT